MASQAFPASSALQDYLLKEVRPGDLALVPHQRLARQVWGRQQRWSRERGLAVWEPLPLKTLGNWWADLCRSLWLPRAAASPLQRLACWHRALETGPALAGVKPDLSWAQALDEAYSLLSRHRLSLLEPHPLDSPLISWRRRLMGRFEEILRQAGFLPPGELPVYLHRALEANQLSLPARLLLVGLETPAPVETAWLQAVAGRLPVTHIRVQGPPGAVDRAVVLPDRRQEVAWAAARLLEQAAAGIPLHRLALTALDLDNYRPEVHRVLAELLGPATAPEGCAYNFSQGPVLEATPFWQAALLPLKFVAAGELREDLVALLLSPYYGVFQEHRRQLPLWDRRFREARLEQGWPGLSRVAARSGEAVEVLALLDQAWQILDPAPARGRAWTERLLKVWRLLGFPQRLDDTETDYWSRTQGLLAELAQALAGTKLSAPEFREWLNLGARRLLLPGPGVQDAGLQVLGLLEMRGLDFDRVICLGMNSGVFPPPPRPLPLLSPGEKQRVLGGTYHSQHRFARELYDTLLAAAPKITLTRPRTADQEEGVATSMFTGTWEEEELAPLSRPHPAWFRSAAVRAAFTAWPAEAPPAAGEPPVCFNLPLEISLTQAQMALGCACRFLLEALLKIRELPEIEAGLPPAERGDLLHKVLARFAGEFNQILEQHPDWDEALSQKAAERLAATVRLLLQDRLPDLHWQAEMDRWLGEEGLLQEWLRRERERYCRGWRWLALEEGFQGLTGPDWPFSLKGRIDRIDGHPEEGLILWDYKTGKIPKAKQVFEAEEEFQLPGYLAAVKQGKVAAAPGQAPLKAGYICLKSAREKDLQHQDFAARAGEWDHLVARWAARLTALGKRLTAGDFRPEPCPAPQGQDKGACQYCPYLLLCGFLPAESAEVEAEGE